MKIHMAALMAAALLGGCMTTQAVSPRIDLVDRPPLNAVSVAEIGDTIVEKGRLSTFDGLRLRNSLTWGDGFIMKRFNIEPGKLRVRQRDKTFDYYYSDNMTVYDALLGTSVYGGGGLCIKRSDPTFVRAFIVSGVCNIKPKAAPVIEAVRITDEGQPGFRQELIYNGRSGDTVKFLYREFAGDTARPPFSQEVQYDLKDGDTIGFKSVRIQIVEASNTRLTYRVISSFPDAP